MKIERLTASRMRITKLHSHKSTDRFQWRCRLCRRPEHMLGCNIGSAALHSDGIQKKAKERILKKTCSQLRANGNQHVQLFSAFKLLVKHFAFCSFRSYSFFFLLHVSLVAFEALTSSFTYEANSLYKRFVRNQNRRSDKRQRSHMGCGERGRESGIHV